jgi:AraC-like DNA-binding protein
MKAPLIAALVVSRSARAALRRAVPRGRARVLLCKGGAQALRALALSLTDAVVADPRLPGACELLETCRARFPGVPRFVYAAFRPDDGELLARCFSRAEASLIVEGVDEAVLPELLLSRTATASRVDVLSAAPRLLRLTEPLQQRAWSEVLRRMGGRLRAAEVARALRISREHLSRQFGAGGAPNLKRVIDLARTATAADLLRNPGYSVRDVARILGFSSPSHLAGAVRRVAGVPPRRLAGLGPGGVLHAFLAGRTRSRAG